MVALTIDAVFLAVAFGIRTVAQARRTGDSGWRLSRPHSTAEAVARGSMFGSAALVIVGLATSPASPPAALFVTGVTGTVASIAFVALAQFQMGASWRIGVDPDERTELVRSGVYARVRNPIYTGMATFVVAHVALTPSWWVAAAAVAMIVGVEIQVRAVEEPYLTRLHGAAYANWARRTGRFLPSLRAQGN